MSGATLVTGATGFVGGHLLDRLAGTGPVAAWYRPDGRPPDLDRDVDWLAVDLFDRPAGRRLDDGEVQHHDPEQGRDDQQQAADDVGDH